MAAAHEAPQANSHLMATTHEEPWGNGCLGQMTTMCREPQQTSASGQWPPHTGLCKQMAASGKQLPHEGHHRPMAASAKWRLCARLSLPMGLAGHRAAGDTESSQPKRDKFCFHTPKAGLGVLHWGSGTQRAAISPPLQGHNDAQASSGLTALCGLSTAALCAGVYSGQKGDRVPHRLALHHVSS